MSSNDDLMRALGRIEAKLDAINARQQEIKEDVEDIETRVRTLENFKAWLAGIGVASGAVTSYLLKKLGY